MKVSYREDLLLESVKVDDREFQPRLDYDQTAIDALAHDIERNGQHNPIGVRLKGDYYQVVYGFQRVLALRKLGWHVVRANIYEDATWQELHTQSISNNERHLDLNDLERALYIAALKKGGMTVTDISEAFGINKSAIYNLSAVSELDDSAKECLYGRFITLNHAVELARIADISKRLETLIDVLSNKWSVRELKQSMMKEPVRAFSGTLGNVELCPQHLTATFVDKLESEEEMKARGLGAGAVKQAFVLRADNHNCEECQNFRGLTQDWFVQCAFSLDSLTAGIRHIVEMSQDEGWALHSNPENETCRIKWWQPLVKPPQDGVILMPLSSLRCIPAICDKGDSPLDWLRTIGGFAHSVSDFNREITQTKVYLDGLKKRLDALDGAQGAEAIKEFKFLHDESLALQNYWAEKTIEAARELGKCLNEIRDKWGPSVYQVFTTYLREGKLHELVELFDAKAKELSAKQPHKKRRQLEASVPEG